MPRATMPEINRTLVLGAFGKSAQKVGRSALHCRVTIEYGRDKLNPTHLEPRLSICGETYYPGRRDIESGGQILDDVRALLDDENAKLNFPRTDIERLLQIWDRWHLNYMRADCEHQRATWNVLEPITLVRYELRPEVTMLQRRIERLVLESVSQGGTAKLESPDLDIYRLPYEVTVGDDQPRPGPEYETKERDITDRPMRETKAAGWVRPDKHPKGLLNKPCPTCGYKYGSAWLYEAVPADVVAFLEGFGRGA